MDRTLGFSLVNLEIFNPVHFVVASCIILLFEGGKITFDPDLIREDRLEIRGLLGQSMGSSC